MNKIGFRQMLKERQEAINSLVCVGLDPLPEKIPAHLAPLPGSPEWLRIAQWMCEIVDTTAPYASMFKPQIAHYEAIPEGQKALQAVISHIHRKYPNIPVFLDCKRGDIDRTQKRYAIAEFEINGADGMNFSPYMGKDCMAQLVDPKYLGKGIVGLCYTSNKSAREVQDVKLADGRHYWEFIAECTLRWATELNILGDAGLVMAAAYEREKGSGDIFSWHLKRCREIVGDTLWFLIPGIGTQGGFVAETVKTAYVGLGSIAINSSSEINFASFGEDFAEAAGLAAKKLCDQIAAAMEEVEK